MTVTAELQADRRQVVDDYGTVPRTVVAVPPSSADAYEVGYGGYTEGYAGSGATFPNLMVVYIGGSPILRPFDPEME